MLPSGRYRPSLPSSCGVWPSHVHRPECTPLRLSMASEYMLPMSICCVQCFLLGDRVGFVGVIVARCHLLDILVCLEHPLDRQIQL